MMGLLTQKIVTSGSWSAVLKAATELECAMRNSQVAKMRSGGCMNSLQEAARSKEQAHEVKRSKPGRTCPGSGQ
jgi:hypothetical protein